MGSRRKTSSDVFATRRLGPCFTGKLWLHATPRSRLRPESQARQGKLMEIPPKLAGGCAITDDSSTGFATAWACDCFAGGRMKCGVEQRGGPCSARGHGQLHRSSQASPLLMSVMRTDHGTSILSSEQNAINTVPRFHGSGSTRYDMSGGSGTSAYTTPFSRRYGVMN